MKSKRVHIVSHSHWDREWYFTSTRSTVYLINHVKEILELLENNKEFKHYLMDAQSSLVEDYLKFCPEDEERLKKLISEKRFLIGPWYTQTDQLVISQESVVRNLLYGMKTADSMGYCMKIAYAPDIFGQGGNMPRVYNQFGMDKFLFWRGVSDNRSEKTEFIWEGSDGSKMLAVEMPFGYHFGGIIPENNDDMIEHLNQYLSVLDKRSTTKHLYFPNGFDQAPIRKNLLELIEKLNYIDKKREYIFSSPEQFFQELKEEVSDLITIKGELTEGKGSRVHKSIFSTRADLKQMNNQTENFIVNILEPLLCISHSLGHRYPQKEVEKIWKLMFENAAHDSIGGCNSDDTNKDVYYRYKTAMDYAKNLLELNMRLISAKIPQNENYTFNIFNTLPYTRSGVMKIKAYIPEEDFSIYDFEGNKLYYTILSKVDQTEYVLNQQISLNPSKKIFIPSKVYLAELLVDVKDIPSLGYSQIYFKTNESSNNKKEESKTNIIENSFYKIELEENNTLTITEKMSGKVYKNQMELEENGDDGDSYNYSPPREDMVISSKIAELLDMKVIKSDVEQRIEASFKLKVPKNLSERAKGNADSEIIYIANISLRKNEKIVRLQFKFNNKVYNHRICVVFDTAIASSLSTADQIFGVIQRPVRLKEMNVWEEEQWHETPISIEPMQSYVSLHNKERGSAIITDGVREYEIIGEKFDKIRLTLFRTFNYMGKENLLYRPGRASGETIIKTEDALLLGEINCEFALYLYNRSFDDAKIAEVAKEYLTPLISYQSSDFLNGRLIFSWTDKERKLNNKYSLSDFEKTDAIMSCLKKSEYSDNYLIRFFNPFLEKNVQIDKNNIKEAVKLDEKITEKIQKKLKFSEFQTYILKV